MFNWVDGANKYRYTPHFLVANGEGGGYYCTIQTEAPGVTAQHGETLLAFNALCREQGWQFRLIAAAAVYAPNFSTLQKLYLRSLDASAEESDVCLQLLPGLVWPATIREVLSALPASSLAALCYCLFSGRLLADLSQALTLDLIIQGPYPDDDGV
ncbi:hypothetical protein CP336_13875 [Pseudomonas fluorescens]|nr:hypothetical protein CP336_13875 [Pseudomonas fluorescens]